MASVALTVDQTMQGWGSWVKVQKANPSCDKVVLARNEMTVRSAYESYQQSMRVARLAYVATANDPTVSPLDAALKAVEASKVELVKLVTILSKP